MNETISECTQAALLLTAPLRNGRGGDETARILTLREYNNLCKCLAAAQKTPADLLSPGAEECIDECKRAVEPERLRELLARGFMLGQATQRWRARGIWFFGRGDDNYPQRLKQQLRARAPSVVYGCGERALLECGGLAVIGSRNINDELAAFAREVGSLAGKSGAALISGAARGTDLQAMRGALENGGSAVGVLSNGLEQAATNNEHRELIADGRLTLISPYDPGAGFNIALAMGRNKLIYALADAALVVQSDMGKGGTWAGATEQLDNLHLTPVYVRAESDSEGLRALQKKGALPWPSPDSPQSLKKIFPAADTQQESRALFA